MCATITDGQVTPDRWRRVRSAVRFAPTALPTAPGAHIVLDINHAESCSTERCRMRCHLDEVTAAPRILSPELC